MPPPVIIGVSLGVPLCHLRKEPDAAGVASEGGVLEVLSERLREKGRQLCQKRLTHPQANARRAKKQETKTRHGGKNGARSTGQGKTGHETGTSDARHGKMGTRAGISWPA